MTPNLLIDRHLVPQGFPPSSMTKDWPKNFTRSQFLSHMCNILPTGLGEMQSVSPQSSLNTCRSTSTTKAVAGVVSFGKALCHTLSGEAEELTQLKQTQQDAHTTSRPAAKEKA
eukprot:3117223-Amphidinium_carterae.2